MHLKKNVRKCDPGKFPSYGTRHSHFFVENSIMFIKSPYDANYVSNIISESLLMVDFGHIFRGNLFLLLRFFNSFL